MHINGKHRGQVGYHAVLLLLVVSTIFIAYMHLGQTHLKSSKLFEESKVLENFAISSSNATLNEINNSFIEYFPTVGGTVEDYKVPLDSEELSNTLKKPNEIKPFFYNTFHDFASHDFFYTTSGLKDGLKAHSFINEKSCYTEGENNKCRILEIVSVAYNNKEFMRASLLEVKFNFTISSGSDTQTQYVGYEVIKETNNLDLIKDSW